MRAIVLTAIVAGFGGLSAGVWLKSTVLATAATAAVIEPAATISVFEMMHNAPRDLPVTAVADYM